MNLRETINRQLDISSSPDPGVVAQEIIEKLRSARKEVLLDLLKQALRMNVRQVITERRMLGRGGTLEAAMGRTKLPPTSTRSWRRDSIRDHERVRLREQYVVHGTWKWLADMSASDLFLVAQDRRNHAARNVAVAEELERWGQILLEHDVPTFGKLPDEILDELLGADEGSKNDQRMYIPDRPLDA